MIRCRHGPIRSAYLAQSGPEVHAHRAFIEIDGRQVSTSLSNIRAAEEAGNFEVLFSDGFLLTEGSSLEADLRVTQLSSPYQYP